MKKKGFLLNSAVLALLIPLLLLLATYEDVSSQIIFAQSERSQIERTGDVVSYLTLEFQKALEISGKRAVVTAVDYVSTTGEFIPPNVKANNTIADLVIRGSFPPGVIRGNYNPEKLMKGQTIQAWFSNVSRLLREQGYILSGDISAIKITVAPLDAFTLVIRAKIPRVTIKDMSGMVVYSGPIPSNGGYVYSTVDLNGLEDPMFSAVTGGRYHRSLQACQYPYPGLGMRPVIGVNGSGKSKSKYLIGRFGEAFSYNKTYIWDSNGDYLTHLTMNGHLVDTDSLILHNRDLGVLIFPQVSSGGSTGGWCDPDMDARVNVTLPSNAPLNSLVLLEFDSSVPFANAAHSGNRASIRIYKAGSSCEPAPYWIEYWGSDKILIWINTTNARKYTIYYSNNPSLESDGNIAIFPIYNQSVTLSAGTEKSSFLSDVPWDSFFVRYSLKSNNTNDFDSGIEIAYNSSKCILVVKSISESWFSNANTQNIQIPIYLSAKNISDLGAQWAANKAAITVKDINGNPVPFWIEYWNSNGALIWVKANLTDDETLLEKFIKVIYGFMPSFIQNWMKTLFGGWLSDTYYNAFLICPSDGQPTRGDGNKVFEFFDDFNGNSLNTTKWNVEQGSSGSYTTSNGILTLEGDNNYRTSDVWIWSRKKFPYYSYVIGLGVKVNSSADQGWLWYIKSTGEGWMEYVYQNKWSNTKGHLYTFDVNDGEKNNEHNSGGKYTTDEWTHVEIAIEKDGSYADITTYQNQSGPFTGTWSGNTSEVSYYDYYKNSKYGFRYSISAKNNTAIGLAQFKGSTEYDFVYVRKYLNLDKLYQSSVLLPKVDRVEFIDDNPGHEDHGGDKLAILKNWTTNLANYPGTWALTIPQRYEIIVKKGSNNLDLTFIHSPNLTGSSESTATVGASENTKFRLFAVIDNNQGNDAYFDWIVAAPYPYVSYPSSKLSISSIEWNPSSGLIAGKAYNIEPFMLCINEMERVGNITGGLRYVAVPWGMSFLERLEGSDQNHEAYVKLSEEMQKELGINFDDRYYPIGLMSFMTPTLSGEAFDEQLNRLFKGILHVSPEENVSSVDYCFLDHYFGKLHLINQTVCSQQVYRVYGISDYPNRKNVYFFIDERTAKYIMGTLDLLQRGGMKG